MMFARGLEVVEVGHCILNRGCRQDSRPDIVPRPSVGTREPISVSQPSHEAIKSFLRCLCAAFINISSGKGHLAISAIWYVRCFIRV